MTSEKSRLFSTSSTAAISAWVIEGRESGTCILFNEPLGTAVQSVMGAPDRPVKTAEVLEAG